MRCSITWPIGRAAARAVPARPSALDAAGGLLRGRRPVPALRLHNLQLGVFHSKQAGSHVCTGQQAPEHPHRTAATNLVPFPACLTGFRRCTLPARISITTTREGGWCPLISQP